MAYAAVGLLLSAAIAVFGVALDQGEEDQPPRRRGRR
jgi:hypothetical protein